MRAAPPRTAAVAEERVIHFMCIQCRRPIQLTNVRLAFLSNCVEDKFLVFPLQSDCQDQYEIDFWERGRPRPH